MVIMEILTYNFYGNFGITANNIKHITQYKNCIYLWFTDKYIDDEPYDLEVPFTLEADAKDSYDELLSLVRRYKMRLVK